MGSLILNKKEIKSNEHSPQSLITYDQNEAIEIVGPLDVKNVDISFPNHMKMNIPKVQVEYIRKSLNENIEIKPIVKILKSNLFK